MIDPDKTPSDSLVITVRDEPGGRIVSIRGDAGLGSEAALASALDAAVASGAKLVVTDLSEATFVDSMVLATLLRCSKLLRSDERRLAVVCPEPSVARLFELTLLDQTFAVVSSLDDVLDPPSGGP